MQTHIYTRKDADFAKYTEILSRRTSEFCKGIVKTAYVKTSAVPNATHLIMRTNNTALRGFVLL